MSEPITQAEALAECIATLQHVDGKLLEWAGVYYVKRPLARDLSDTADVIRATMKRARAALGEAAR